MNAERSNQDLIGRLISDAEPVPGPAPDLQRADRDDLRLQSAVQEFDALSVNACAVGHDRPAWKKVRVTEIPCLIPNPRPVDVAERGVEIALDFLGRQPPSQSGSIRCPQSQAEGAVVPAQSLRIGLQEPCIRLQHAAVAHSAVQIAEVRARNRIAEVGIGIPLRHHDAERGLSQHAQRRTASKDIAALDVAELSLPYGQPANAPGTDSPAQLASVVQVHGLARIAEPQAPGEKRPAVLSAGPRGGPVHVGSLATDAAEFEDVGILQKERPPLRKKEIESRQVHLPGVDFGGREVGIQRQCTVQRGGDLVEQIQRGARHGRIAGRFEDPATIQRDRGHNVEAEPLLQTCKACRQADDARVVGAITGNPGDFLPLPAHRAGKVDAPGVVFRIERDRLQGNRNLRDPAVGACGRCDVPDRIPDRKVLADVLVDRFMLDAVGVGFELVAAAPVVVGRQDHRDSVIVTEPKRPVTQGTGGDQVGLAVPEASADVQRIVIVEQVDHGTFRRFSPLDGLRLMKIVYDGCPRPDGVVHTAVDHRRRVRPYHSDRLHDIELRTRLLSRAQTGQHAHGDDARGHHLAWNRHGASGLRCGKRITSRMEGESVSSMIRRSMPKPSPAAGGIPYSRARM